MAYQSLVLYYRQQKKWSQYQSIQYLSKELENDPYNLYIYLYLFPLLYKKKHFHTLKRVLKNGVAFLPYSLKLKELLFFFLSHHQYRSRYTASVLLDTILPLIKKKQDSRFLLYCVSVYFFRRGILDSALFYIQLGLKPNLSCTVGYLQTQYLLTLERIKDISLLKATIHKNVFKKSKDQVGILSYLSQKYLQTMTLESNTKYNNLQLYYFRGSKESPLKEPYKKKQLGKHHFFLWGLIALLLFYIYSLFFIAW